MHAIKSCGSYKKQQKCGFFLSHELLFGQLNNKFWKKSKLAKKERKKLYRRCFPLNWEKFFRIAFLLQEPLGSEGLIFPCIMLRNGQTYLNCSHRKIFKVCLATFSTLFIKGLIDFHDLTKTGNSFRTKN